MDINNVWQLLDNAKWYADAILNGDSNDEGTFYKSNDSIVIKKINIAKNNLEGFINMAKVRYASRQQATAGSLDDQNFDKFYEEIQKLLGNIIKSSPNIGSSANFVRYKLANAHLFFEELLSGDDENKIEDIIAQMENGKSIAIEKLGIDGANAGSMIEQLIALTKKRHTTNQSTGKAGGKADKDFDTFFENFIGTADDAETAIQGVMTKSKKNMEAAKSFAISVIIIGTILTVLIAIFFGWLASSNMTKPLLVVRKTALAIANGDLTVESKSPYTDVFHDEFTDVIFAVEKMRLDLIQLVGTLSDNASIISSSSAEQSSIVLQIASSTEEMSSSIDTVATAIEEMSATVNEISISCQKELDVANNANTQAQSTNVMMQALETSANEIGKVLDVIKDIADQTNLLALNATIEAASAGDAGKGFAVVASEVKELAKQTASATDEIGKQIQTMRSSTTDSVKAISDITDIIAEVNTISTTIVSAVEEQSATINEIAKNVSGVSSASSEVSQNVMESATGLNEISSNISGFTDAIGNVTTGMSQVTQSATDLSDMSNSLKKSVDSFKI